MSDDKTFIGTIASCEYKSTSKTGWETWACVFTDGRTEQKCVFPGDSAAKPKAGLTVPFTAGKFAGSWVIDSKRFKELQEQGGSGGQAPAQNAPTGQGASSGSYSTGKSSFNESRDEFNRYQIEKRDPQIKLQSYERMVVDMYMAALPYLAQAPSTPEEVNAYLDDAFIKAAAVSQSRDKA